MRMRDNSRSLRGVRASVVPEFLVQDPDFCFSASVAPLGASTSLLSQPLRHIYSLTQVGPLRAIHTEKYAKIRRRRRGVAGELAEQGASRANGALGDAREMFGETPRYEKTAVWLPQLTRRDQRPWDSSAPAEMISLTEIFRNE